MNDTVKFLYTYLDDPAEIMSKARVLETINEIEKLRDTLTYTQMAEQAALEDRAALRELLELSRPYVGQADGILADRIDDFLKEIKNG